MQGGIDTHRNAEQEREQRRDERKLHGRGKALGDQIDRRLLELIGRTEVEMSGAPNKARKLHHNGIIEAKLLAQGLAFLRACFNADHLVDRVADKTEERESDQRDHDHDKHCLNGAAEHEGEHDVQTFNWCLPLERLTWCERSLLSLDRTIPS